MRSKYYGWFLTIDNTLCGIRNELGTIRNELKRHNDREDHVLKQSVKPSRARIADTAIKAHAGPAALGSAGPRAPWSLF